MHGSKISNLQPISSFYKGCVCWYYNLKFEKSRFLNHISRSMKLKVEDLNVGWLEI